MKLRIAALLFFAIAVAAASAAPRRVALVVQDHTAGKLPVPVEALADTFAARLSGAGLAVEGFAAEFHGEVEGGGSGGQADGALAADHFGGGAFDFVDVGAEGGDPVGADGFVDPLLLLAVHGGGGEPELGRERRKAGETGVLDEICHRFNVVTTGEV